MSEDKWNQTCFTCMFDSGLYGCGTLVHQCSHKKKRNVTNKGGITRFCYRVPNTHSKYEKCPYYQKIVKRGDVNEKLR
jgi:hypothetical protein